MIRTRSGVRAYLARIGQQGGRKSRRCLSSDDARNMVRVRLARQAFRAYHAQCFWYMRPEAKVTLTDLPVIARGLRLYGGRRGYLLAAKLCP